MSDNEQKCAIISELKAHIKRDFVDLSQVPRYFEALKVANKSQDYKLASLAFSSTCHLVKRVGMQDPNALRGPSKVVLPILFTRLMDSKLMFQQQAKSTLETFWLATPTIVEAYIRDSALIHSNPKIRAESIVFLSDLIELNRNFNFSSLLPNLVNLLGDDSVDVVKNAEVLILKYYTLHKSKCGDLVNEFKGQHVDPKRALRLLKEIDVPTANAYSTEIMASNSTSKPTIDTFNNLLQTTRRAPPASRKTQLVSAPVKSTTQPDAVKDLSDILGEIQTAKLDESLKPITVNSASELNREIEGLIAPFAGKETEFNWGNREKSIVRFRGLVVGNAEQYPHELVTATRAMHEGINKAILSLRTTLSSNGCQLVKELAIYLSKYLDPITENLFTPLATLTSATKKIASLNAYGSLCVLLVNTSFNNRLFNHCFSLYQDKNVQPRLYSSTFLHIFILKHSSKLDQINFETINKWIGKGVSDPSTTVREAMRTTFWALHRKFPEVSEAVYAKQDTSVKKALERCKPRGVEGPSSRAQTTSKPGLPQFERKRPSVREFIQSKRDRSTSGPQLNSAAASPQVHEETAEEPTASVELGRPARIGVPQRVRVSSAGAATSSSAPLQRVPSKGSKQDSERQQRWSTLGAASRDNTIEVQKTPPVPQQAREDNEVLSTIEKMKKCLSSPLTRERVQGIEMLKDLISRKVALPDMSQILSKLVILDAMLLKPFLSSPEFCHLMDVTLAIKVLAVNKVGADILLGNIGNEQVAKGLVTLIQSLDTLQFENAPSTMFHVKHKSLFLDYSVQNLYRITSDETSQFEPSLLSDITTAVFPLCISDYPRYDELIVQLHSLNSEIFDSVLNSSSGYVQAKIASILEEFKDDIEEKHVDATIPLELTMINPFNVKGSSTATEIISQRTDDMMDVDHPEEKPNTDFMSDIFAAKDSREPTRDFTFVGPTNVAQRLLQHDEGYDLSDSSPEPDAVPVSALAHVPSLEPEQPRMGSPFLDAPHEADDIIADDVLPVSHEVNEDATRNITSQINGIHISPQKEEFIVPDRKSLTEIIHKTDPIFNRTKKHIQIYEDAPSVTNAERKLFDFELSRVQQMSDEDATIAQILTLVSKFNNDDVGPKEMNTIIKVLHQAISKDDVTSWMKESGFKTILGSVVNYFNSSVNITKELCFKGLIVLKELLIIDEFLDGVLSISETVSIWNILIMVVENLRDFRNAIYVSVEELVDDVIKLDVGDNKQEILKSCLLNLKESESTLSTSFLLATLTKCIEIENLSLDQIKEIDSTVFKFLTHDEVEVRRLTIITYSKCKRKLQQIDFNTQVTVNDKFSLSTEHAYNELFAKLSLPQRKLVDYYCET